jgi:predicted dienelactone hydrolase
MQSRIRQSSVLFALILATSFLSACHGDRMPEGALAQRGPSEVGFRVLEQERENAAPLAIKAWYPAVADSNGDPEIVYDIVVDGMPFSGGAAEIYGSAQRDASPDDTTAHPLVVFSHGFTFGPEWYHQMAEHLASHGFVVLAPDHEESGWKDDVLRATVTRPWDISDTLDFAETEPFGPGIIDLEHVAVVGHSYGGYTALAVGGARIEPSHLEERCRFEFNLMVRDLFCNPFVGKSPELAEHMGLDDVPNGLWPSMRDERVDAIVPMAPNAYLFGPSGLAQVKVPTLLLGGTGDTSAPWDWGTGMAWEHISSEEAVLVPFDGAEHMLPVADCDTMPFTDELNPLFHSIMCADYAWDKAAGHANIHQLTTAFLKRHLQDDVDAQDVLVNAMLEPIDGLDVIVR